MGECLDGARRLTESTAGKAVCKCNRELAKAASVCRCGALSFDIEFQISFFLFVVFITIIYTWSFHFPVFFISLLVALPAVVLQQEVNALRQEIVELHQILETCPCWPLPVGKWLQWQVSPPPSPRGESFCKRCGVEEVFHTLQMQTQKKLGIQPPPQKKNHPCSCPRSQIFISIRIKGGR